MRILKKEEASGERVYECGDGKTNAVSLTISNNENGEQEFYLGNYKLNDSYKVIGDADAGYRVENADGTSVKLEIEDQNYNIVGGDAIKLTTVKLPGETVYFVNGKMASVEFGPAGLVIQKIDGKGVSLIAGNKQVTLDEMVSSLSLATRVIRRLLILLHLQLEKSCQNWKQVPVRQRRTKRKKKSLWQMPMKA